MWEKPTASAAIFDSLELSDGMTLLGFLSESRPATVEILDTDDDFISEKRPTRVSNSIDFSEFKITKDILIPCGLGKGVHLISLAGEAQSFRESSQRGSKTMTLILVLLMFGTFIAIDYFRNRHRPPQVAEQKLPQSAPHFSLGDYVEGFHVPETVRYHAGHGWALRERSRLARVGVDEFGASLLGGVERIELPKPGRWVRQGQKAWTFYRDGEKCQMVSPVEGEVVEVNEEVLKDPSLLRKDPFGSGWLMTVHVPDEESVRRNFLPVHLVKDWIRECAERLFAEQPQLAGPVMADGGRPIESLTAAMPDSSWKELTKEFFLTE